MNSKIEDLTSALGTDENYYDEEEGGELNEDGSPQPSSERKGSFRKARASIRKIGSAPKSKRNAALIQDQNPTGMTVEEKTDESKQSSDEERDDSSSESESEESDGKSSAK